MKSQTLIKWLILPEVLMTYKTKLDDLDVGKFKIIKFLS